MAEPISAAETKAAEEAGQNLNPEIHRVMAGRKRITIDLRADERRGACQGKIFDLIRDVRTRSRRPLWRSWGSANRGRARRGITAVVDVFRRRSRTAPWPPDWFMFVRETTRNLPSKFKLAWPSRRAHASEDEINKQLADKGGGGWRTRTCSRS